MAAGLLSETPPANQPVPASAPTATRTLSGSAEDLLVTVSVTPNRPGVNGFTVLVASSRRPPPAPVDDVALELAPPDGAAPDTSLPLELVRPGRYLGTGTLGGAGRWHLTAVVHRGAKRLVLPLSWTVAPQAPARLVPAPGRRLAPITETLAVCILLLVIVAAGGWVRSRRRRSRVGSRDRPADEPIAEEAERVPEAVP
jgi:copper transport protein